MPSFSCSLHRLGTLVTEMLQLSRLSSSMGRELDSGYIMAPVTELLLADRHDTIGMPFKNLLVGGSWDILIWLRYASGSSIP